MVSTDDARTDATATATRIDVLVADLVAAFVRAGGVWGGEVVVGLRVTVELESGETLRTGHRRRAPVASNSDDQLTQQQQRIVAVLASSPKPLKRIAAAHLLGLKQAAGSFGQSVSRLRDSGVIFERDGRITDDESKFEDTT